MRKFVEELKNAPNAGPVDAMLPKQEGIPALMEVRASSSSFLSSGVVARRRVLVSADWLKPGLRYLHY